jgi:predicted metal-dependent hydrolase
MAGLLRKLVTAWADVPHEPHFITVDGKRLQVRFRSNARAKRMVLRLSRDAAGVVVTLPKRVSRTQGLAFVDKSMPWIAKQFERRPPATVIADGTIIPLYGMPHTVQATHERRGLIKVDAETNTIHVPGDISHLARRLEDWLKKLARSELTEASQRYAKAMDVDIKRISIRDQKSRWGSCSASGDLSYSWRLILAPPFVLDYVVAHEVAHRQHMNHGPKFWRLVLTHCPRASEAKHWFKQHSSELHRFTTTK